LFKFQWIGIQTWKFLIFANFGKKSDVTKNEKMVQKINFPKSDEDR